MKTALSVLCALAAAALVWVIGGYVDEYLRPYRKVQIGRVK